MSWPLRIATLSKGGGGLSRLFANGEDGFLFGNFGDLSGLFTTYQGQTQVANDADPVGLALENSRWQKRTLAAQIAQATEGVRNQSMAGAVAGTPGTFPTNWSMNALASGLSRSVVGAGTGGNGNAYIDIRIFGTPTATGFAEFGFDTQIPALNNQVLRYSLQLGFVAGSMTNFGTGYFKIDELTSGSSYIRSSVVNLLSTITSTVSERIAYMQITGGVTVAKVAAYFGFPVTNGLAVDATFRFVLPSVKLVSGNHALQATTTFRPVYKPNSGKPYLLFDGTDDRLVTPFLPSAAVSLAAAFRVTSTGSNQIIIGGGASAGSKRCFLAVNGASGQLSFGWGSYTVGDFLLGSDITGTDHVAVLSGDASLTEVWLDGVRVHSTVLGPGPDGSGGGIALGCYNNAGSVSSVMTGRMSAAMAINRKLTPSEIALITSKFRSTYQ